MIKNINQVWSYYLHQSAIVYNQYTNPVVLKADASNEALDLPFKCGIAGYLKGDIICLEKNPVVVEKARLNCPNIRIIKGSITKIPFNEGIFDVILDLSTIDHVHPEELEQAIIEYARVIKKEGTVFLVSWVTGNTKYKEDQRGFKKESANNQYYHQHDEFNQLLIRFFKITKTEQVWQESDITLQAYWLKKND